MQSHGERDAASCCCEISGLRSGLAENFQTGNGVICVRERLGDPGGVDLELSLHEAEISQELHRLVLAKPRVDLDFPVHVAEL